jgi:hypothetical protein
MWIEKVPPFLFKLTIVEKSSLIAQFHCFIILIKFQYANNTITRQCGLKETLVIFLKIQYLELNWLKPCIHPKFENVALANNEHQTNATKFYICSIENDQKMD